MFVLLTSSKTMDFQNPIELTISATTPWFEDEANKIRKTLASKSQHEIQTLQHISPRLASKVMAMNQADPPAKKSALWAYKGDVYKGFKADTLSRAAADWAQQHIRIPSGMYGLVRPCDEIVPYRLEMKTNLSVEGSKDLYDFWGDRQAKKLKNEEVVVLASDEYARAVTRHIQDKTKIYDVSFVDVRSSGKEGKVPIYNKIMRGVVARWLADTQAASPANLKEFQDKGYRYSTARSSSHHFVFYRTKPGPIAL